MTTTKGEFADTAFKLRKEIIRQADDAGVLQEYFDRIRYDADPVTGEEWKSNPYLMNVFNLLGKYTLDAGDPVKAKAKSAAQIKREKAAADDILELRHIEMISDRLSDEQLEREQQLKDKIAMNNQFNAEDAIEEVLQEYRRGDLDYNTAFNIIRLNKDYISGLPELTELKEHEDMIIRIESGGAK